MRNKAMILVMAGLMFGGAAWAQSDMKQKDALIFTAPDGYKSVEFGTITANQIEDTKVYDPKDEMIGRIEDIVIGADGKISGVVVDVGGFLGIGGHVVALGQDTISFFNGADGVLRAYVGLTKEQLKALPAYKDPA